VKILDRYVVREILPPFLLALGVFTFLLAIKPMLDQAQTLLAKGVDLPTVAFLLLTLLPQALGITIPMAFLTGLLMALGRLSSDREAVALLACGVSPLRILRPVLLLAVLAGAVNMYLLIQLVPDANQRFRVETFNLLLQKSESDIKPGLFFEGFPGKVIRINEMRPGGGWRGVMLADTTVPGRPSLVLAPEGFLEVDRQNRLVTIVLPGESVRYRPGDTEGVYDTARGLDLRFKVEAASVFGTGDQISRGRAEMTIADLRREEARKIEAGVSPHPEVLHRHQMFSFPVACLVFALVGVALGLHTRKEGKLGGFTLGIGVIFLYYGVMQLAEALVKGGQMPPEWARWIPNIVVAVVGLVALRARMRNSGREWAVTLPGWMARLPRFLRHSAGPAKPASEFAAPLAAAPNESVVVVIRFPEIELPRVRLLDRYVSRRYLSVAMLSFFGLIGLYYIGTLIDKSERLFKGEATAAMLVEYFYYSTPQFIAYVAPMAVLVAVLATIGGLMRTGELVVMRACGVSLYRVGLPLIVLALVWSGGLFLLDDRVLAHANRRAETLEDQIRGSLNHTTNTIANSNWLADRDGRIYYYSAFDTQARTLYGLSVFDPVADGSRLESHTYAARAVFDDDGWTASAGWSNEFKDPTTSVRKTFETRGLDLEAPENFSGMHNQAADLMTYGDLRQHVDNLAASGFSLSDTRVELARRIAFPFVTIVMTVLGIPFGVTTGRRGALYGVGLALVLGAGYWLVDTFFVAVGQAGLLAPWFAAWAANLLFMALAVYAVLTVRT
jgi:LPS export ABC transporter permease LptG/LPS export ABC transporter permease LptF